MANLHIHERSPGVWRLRVRIGKAERYRQVRGTEAAAEAAGAAFLAEIEAAGLAPAKPSTRLSGWIAQCFALRTHLEARTRELYEDIIRLHITPELGNLQLSRIHAPGIEAWQARLLAAGVGVPTVGTATRLVRDVIREAVRKRVLPHDPLATVQRPRQPAGAATARRAVVEPNRFGRILAIDPGRKRGVLLRLALSTGARRGELLALRWPDIDLETGHVSIRRALELLRDGTIRVKAPKHAASVRRIAIDAAMVAELRSWRAQCASAALAAGVSLDDCPVLPGGDGPATWWNPRAATKAASRALRYWNLPGAHLHTMRHSHATALLANRVNPDGVRKRIGHARLATTLGIYGHALPQDDEAAVAVMEAALRPQGRGSC